MYQRRKDTIYFVTYEALKKNFRGEIIKIAKFLEKDLTDEQIDVITDHCSFDSMSTNQSTNYSDLSNVTDASDTSKVFQFNISKFMRKGEVGDWKNYFTVSENVAFDKLYEEKTKNWDLKFEFE